MEETYIDVTSQYETRGRSKEGRIYVEPAEDLPMPHLDQCENMACEGYACRAAHASWLMAILCPSELVELLDPEDDHRQWKFFRRRQIAARRKLIEHAIATGALPDTITNIRFSQHAGCSCPCSPGFVVAGFYGRTAWIVEKVVVDACGSWRR